MLEKKNRARSGAALLLVVLSALVLGGCQVAPPPAAPTTVATTEGLVGKWEEIPGSRTPSPAKVWKVALTFYDSQESSLTGVAVRAETAGCPAAGFHRYEVVDGRLQVGAWGVLDFVGCEEDVQTQGAWLRALLGSRPEIRSDGDLLSIRGDRGSLLLTAVRS